MNQFSSREKRWHSIPAMRKPRSSWRVAWNARGISTRLQACLNKRSQVNRLRAALILRWQSFIGVNRNWPRPNKSSRLRPIWKRRQSPRNGLSGADGRPTALENFPIDLQIQLRSRAAEQRMILSPKNRKKMCRPIILAVCPLLLGVALHGQSSGVFVSRAQEDIAAGRFPQAEEDLSRAVAADPANWKLWSNLGVVRIQLGESELAIKAFERARRLAPQEAPPYFDLGFAYMKASDYEKALEAYRDGLARDPDDVVANQNFAFLLTQNGDFRDAIEPLKRLKSLQPAGRIRAGDPHRSVSESGNEE